MKNEYQTLNIISLVWLIFFSAYLPAQTTINGSFIHDGISRTFRLYIPAIYIPSQEVPLLFNLHGYGSNNIEQEFYADFRPLADTANFIIVHPNGTYDQSNNRFWNAFGASNVDDIGFISALIDTIATNYNINLNKVYSTGMSNGGFMSYHLACLLSDRIAAVASVTGSMVWTNLNACEPSQPIPAIQIHGTADATVPYNGNTFFAPIETVVNFWVQHSNCFPVPQVIQIPDIDPDDGCTAEQRIYSGGDNGASVEFFKVTGGGHSWPGAPININITNMDFSASEEIWRFLSKYSKDQFITGASKPGSVVSSFDVWPNPSPGTINLWFADSKLRTIMILNSLGQVVQECITQSDRITINIDQHGLYIISVIQDKSIEVKKLIIQ